MKLSIVILSYNTFDLVLSCVNSLIKQYKKELEEGDVEIILVDNASEKKVVDGLEKELKDLEGIRLIKSAINLGFGNGNNLASEKANGEHILFLNSDTRVFDRGFFEMADFLKKNPKVAIIGGRLLNSDGTPQSSVGKFYNLVNVILMLFGGGRVGFFRSSPNKLTEVDWVSGACMMVNKEIFNKIGQFDKNIFMYMEDIELCFRAKKNGYSTFYYPKVSVSHMEQGSSNRTFAVVNIYKGILYFYKKHKNKLEYQIVRFLLWLKALGVYLLGRLTNNSYYIKTYGEALKIFK